MKEISKKFKWNSNQIQMGEENPPRRINSNGQNKSCSKNSCLNFEKSYNWVWSHKKWCGRIPMLKEFWKIQTVPWINSKTPNYIKDQIIWILKVFKLYKWLVYYIKRPYKKFQHFRKWLGILFNRRKQMSEKKKGKIRQKIEKGLPVA